MTAHRIKQAALQIAALCYGPGHVHTPLMKVIMRSLRKSTWGDLEKSKDPGLTRRQFMKTATVAGAVAVPFSSLWARQLVTGLGTEKVAILGGGVAGLTAAYDLTKAGVPCEIFEASPRIGGRIWTYDKFNSEGMYCELGGELIDTSHTEVIALAHELGLNVQDLTVDDKGLEEYCFYFGGRHYFEKDMVAAFAPLAAHFKKDIAGLYLDPKNPVVNYKKFTPVAQKWDQITLGAYLDSKKDVEPWVREALKTAYLGEFGLGPEEQGALNLLMMIGTETERDFKLFGSSDESKRIQGGSSRLIEALDKALKGKVEIHLGHELVKIEDKGANLLLTFKEEGRIATRTCPHAICTIPFSLLKRLEGFDQLPLSPVKRRAIQTLGYGLNSKMMLGFTKRTWRQSTEQHSGVTGLTFTDLKSQCYWETSRAQPGKSGILTNFLAGKSTLTDQADGADSCLDDLDQIYPGSKTAADGKRVFFNWSQYMWSQGSYACPRVGQMTTIVGCAEEPELSGKLLFAGEHVSEASMGFINGAIETAQAAVETLTKKLPHRGLASAGKSVSRSVGMPAEFFSS